MKMVVLLFLALHLSILDVDATRTGFIPVVVEGASKIDNHPLEVTKASYFCNSCLEASSKVEKILIDQGLNDEIEALSNEICHVASSPIEDKMCIQRARRYIRQAFLCLKIFFYGENLCKSIQSNLDISRIPISTISQNEVFFTAEFGQRILRKVVKSLLMISLKHKEYKSCAPCRNAVENIHNVVGNTERQIMIIKILHEACEVADTYAGQCKKMVLVYGPLLLGNVQKMVTDNDLCYSMHMCKDPLPPPGPPLPPNEKYIVRSEA